MGSVAVLLIALPLAFAQARSDPNKTAREILADATYQTELPRGPASPRRENGNRFDSSGGRDDLGGSATGTSNAGSPSSGELGFGRMIAYVLGVIGVAALLAVLGRAAVGLRTPRGARVTRVEPEPAAAPSANPNDVDDAATLAAAGRYAEAVHALLLRAIAVLRALAPAPPLPASLTSREIVGNCQQSAASRDALAGIVACVEVSRFGGEPLASSDFDRCETLYRRFRDGLGVAG